MAKSLIFFLVNIWLVAGFAQTQEPDIRSMARDELQRQNPSVEAKKAPLKKGNKKNAVEPAPTTDPGQPPSIMLPLHDPYKPISLRPWQWKFDIGYSNQKIRMAKPAIVIGRENLAELGNLSFLNLNFGFARAQAWGHWGASLVTATTMKSDSIPSSTGSPIKANIQYLSYGLEPFVTKKWTSSLGTTFGLQYELITVAQTSRESDFARWSQSYSSTNLRVGADYFLNENQSVSLSLLDKNSSYGHDANWLLSYGVQW